MGRKSKLKQQRRLEREVPHPEFYWEGGQIRLRPAEELHDYRLAYFLDLDRQEIAPLSFDIHDRQWSSILGRPGESDLITAHEGSLYECLENAYRNFPIEPRHPDPVGECAKYGITEGCVWHVVHQSLAARFAKLKYLQELDDEELDRIIDNALMHANPDNYDSHESWNEFFELIDRSEYEADGKPIARHYNLNQEWEPDFHPIAKVGLRS